ncbi:mannosyl-oligosaccharide alpha-1,2-mannosidase IA-like isoform X1 [Maniola jurtina]|uniref:mannosyl-oligosaccharide alpha-1,2-mannosidase IA-like isoform X1 n=1 Tax=Maniola jurtina TaxID=191418 RepID=UPI001E688F1F|nr:mannosyl-oligosaccharide alpha-1,2-mannosidase IA-like isoform X1 [Maniola jurtina]
MTGILPSYQRFVNGVPVPSISRRSFRLREKYLIISVLLTFGIVWLGALFYLPEFKSSTSVNDSVYNVYKRIQKAGPELLMPPPLAQNEVGDFPVVGIARHGEGGDDPHVVEDRNRLQAKIDEDMGMKVLERPQFDVAPSGSSSRGPSKPPVDAIEEPALGNNAANKNVSPSNQKVDSSVQKYVIPALDPGTDVDVRHKRDTVKEMMRHAWNNYKLYAWGKNELKPMSKRAHLTSVFGGGDLGATIVDGMDTLYIMGMMDEFREGRDWIADHFHINEIDTDLSVFETTIRFVGGLLSCYALTGDMVFRDKAAEVADALLPAFDTPTGIPYALINPSNKVNRQYHWAGANSILSEVGTLHMEFTYLSEVTGNDIYRQKVDRIRDVLHNIQKPEGLYPNYINPRTGMWGQRHTSLGALGDSFYEYLLKAWLVTNNEDEQARMMFDEAMQPALDKMLRTSPSGLSYLAEVKYGRVYEEKMDHLSCFAGGMFALASTTLQNTLSDRYMDVAKKLTHTCHEAYARADTKLSPEAFRFSGAAEARAMKSNEKMYLLRPETFESYFILWRLTKDQKYRDWGWEAVQALEKHCRVEGGYTGLVNVYHPTPLGDDVQQSFFLAETLKYLYLLFSDDSLLPLEEWVFNTEAHPFPVKDRNPLYRAAPKPPLLVHEDNRL